MGLGGDNSFQRQGRILPANAQRRPAEVKMAQHSLAREALINGV